MLDCAIRPTFGVALLLALGGIANAAVPSPGAPPSDKPALNRASPMIYDPVGTHIHGKAPVGTNMVPKDDVQATLPDPTKAKPPLYRASPMIDDRLMGTPIRGKAPTGSNMMPKDDLEATLPDAAKAKPPLYRASPMINDRLIPGTAPSGKPALNRASPMIYDPATTIHGAPPAKVPSP